MRRSEGFTLIEILVVLAIAGVMLGLVIGRGPMRSPGLQLRAAAGAIAQTLRAARAQAIAGDHEVSVTIDPANHRFGVDGGPMRLLAADLPISVLPPAPLGPGSGRGPGPARIIRFSPDGSASGGKILLGAGRLRQGIAVEWLTGRVSVANAP